MGMSICSECKKRLVSTSITATATNVEINVAPEDPIQFDQKLCLVLAQPVPDAGEVLPVVIVIAGTTPVTAPLYKSIGKIKGCKCPALTLGDIVYGIDLPERGRVRIPVFYSDAGNFYDLRGAERLCYCEEV